MTRGRLDVQRERRLAAGAGGQGGLGIVSPHLGEHRGGRGGSGRLCAGAPRSRHGGDVVARRDRTEARVGEDVTVDVLQGEVIPQPVRAPQLDDAPVLGGRHRLAGCPEQIHEARFLLLRSLSGSPAGRRGGRTGHGGRNGRRAGRSRPHGGRPRSRTLGRRSHGHGAGRRTRRRERRFDVGGVLHHARARERQAPLSEARERSDHRLRVGGDQLGAQKHRFDVRIGVVVGEDRGVQIARRARRMQVASCGENRVDRVVGVRVARPECVDPVLQPGLGHELHPAHRTGGGYREVVAIVGLDLVDRREDLPRHPVLDARGLVDRQQEQGHPIKFERLRGDRRLAEQRGQRARLSGHHLRRRRDIVRRSGRHRRRGVASATGALAGTGSIGALTLRRGATLRTAGLRAAATGASGLRALHDHRRAARSRI